MVDKAQCIQDCPALNVKTASGARSEWILLLHAREAATANARYTSDFDRDVARHGLGGGALAPKLRVSHPQTEFINVLRM